MAATAPVTKAVILARGLGTRMRKADEGAVLDEKQSRVAASGVKSMIDVGRPFVEFLFSALADAGISEVCLVIGPEHDMIRDYVAGLETSRVRVSTAIQEEPRGTADAVAAAREFAGNDRFVVINSDNYYPVSALRSLVQAPGAAVVGFDRAALVAGSNIPAERVRAFALLDVADDGTLRDIVEKPSEQQLAQYGDVAPVSMNLWLFTPDIFAACDKTVPSVRGELEIVDSVRIASADGCPFTVVPAAAGVLDMSSRSDVAAVAEALAGVDVSL
ncbi:nucleotidyltransferase family protein [Dermabacteraceae bacterium TAE3-ERU27]|nr:nucleotidyltransferase family protein [Dermabacteraceae bacterium TAE3-ERU27]